ncbi:macrophage mannose receptor 1-like, partial [Ruditapes philippinarum]|uniref:macrophage mannose receptor 1-like n=1 Tax=Ruditapes philippinarum TaxID=129788 RepID=UPI00295B19EA
SKCALEGGTLVQIDSEAVNNYLYTLRSYEGHKYTQEAWIGLGDGETENIFKWEGSQQRVTYTNWRPNEPNNGGFNEDCVEMTVTEKWNDVFCNRKNSYFCERSLTKSCPSGWSLSSGRCYIFKNAKVDWSTAKRNCALEGGTLAQVDSKAVNNFLNTLRSNTGHSTVEAWIGLG